MPDFGAESGVLSRLHMPSGIPSGLLQPGSGLSHILWARRASRRPVSARMQSSLPLLTGVCLKRLTSMLFVLFCLSTWHTACTSALSVQLQSRKLLHSLSVCLSGGPLAIHKCALKIPILYSANSRSSPYVPHFTFLTVTFV